MSLFDITTYLMMFLLFLNKNPVLQLDTFDRFVNFKQTLSHQLLKLVFYLLSLYKNILMLKFIKISGFHVAFYKVIW